MQDKRYFEQQEGSCVVVNPLLSDVDYLSDNIRYMDNLECHSVGLTPHKAMMLGLIEDDITFTVIARSGNPMAMFGAGESNGNAYIWLLGTDEIKDNRYDFLKATRKWVGIISKPYDAVCNYVHADNEVAIKWLKFCGAKFSDNLSFNNEPFQRFTIINN